MLVPDPRNGSKTKSPAIGESLDEELDQRPRERSGVIALTAFGFHLDDVARTGQTRDLVRSTPEQAASGRRLRIIGRVQPRRLRTRD